MVAKAPRGKILNGPICKSAYISLLKTYTKFCAFITKCTIVMIFLTMLPTNSYVHKYRVSGEDYISKYTKLIWRCGCYYKLW